MSISSDGQLCYGIKLDEDISLPWSNDIDHWWVYEINGYTNPLELFDENDEWIGGERAPQHKIDEYYNTRREFDSQHPLPVELVNYCSYDYPMWIAAIPSTVLSCRRGYPKGFSPTQMEWDRNQPFVTAPLLHFVEKYISPIHEEPKWWLSSLYG